MDLKEFEKVLGYHFKKESLLKEALTHKSAKKGAHNERLEL